MSTSNSLFLSLDLGSIIQHKNSTYTITHFLDIEHILAKHSETGKIERLHIAELRPLLSSEQTNGISAPASTIPDEDWYEAMNRFKIIQPLLNASNRNRTAVEERAAEFGKSAGTLYRWISTYTATGVISSLVRRSRSDRGKTRIPIEVEKIIQDRLQDTFLTKQQLSVSKVVEEVTVSCRKAKIDPPHPNTIRNRVSAIAEEEVIKRRRGRKEAVKKFSPIEGTFPGADYPLSVVQIDHTPMDIIIVDEVERLPTGKPWLTLAFDIFSRMVCGFYISLDPPGTMSVALCLAHAILPKEKWLANRDISISWPIWGIPDTLHADNGRDFRGDSLKRACGEYNIDLTWRPVATPNYGGHIERYLGNLLSHIHELPGTTFSNPTERGKYDSEGKAIMTLKELERWITIHILGQYHQRRHSEIGMPPIKKYELGILGNGNLPGRGMPPRIQDEDRVLLDFMPHVERTVQDYGVLYENVHYYSNVLRRWINTHDPDRPKLKRKFIFKYDPRDISRLLFLDPELNMYYPIPYRNTARPAISIWELREATKKAKEEYGDCVNEDIIFSSYEQLREIERKAAKETKAVRRAKQRKSHAQSRIDYIPKVSQTSPESKDSKTPMNTDDCIIDNSNIELLPFDDIDEDIEP